MNRVSDFTARLNEIIAELGVTSAWLVEQTGISKGTISSYRSSAFSPKSDNLKKLAEALGVTVQWLSGYDAPKHPDDTGPQVCHLPVVRQAGCDDLYAAENVLRTEECFSEFADGTCFYMEADDHLYPAACRGDLVLVRISKHLENNDACVIETENGSELFIYSVQSDCTELRCLNPFVQPIRFEEAKHRVIGKVIMTIRKW